MPGAEGDPDVRVLVTRPAGAQQVEEHGTGTALAARPDAVTEASRPPGPVS